jgi:hypothetical protein
MRYPPAAYSSIRYHRLADLHGRTTEWLWPGWLPLGKLALLEGDPGLGKSLLTLDLCARLTSGRDFPDGSPAATPCNVIVLNAEDSMLDTVLPRLRALGGNAERVYNLEGVVDKQGEDVLRFPQHALAIRDLMQVTQARLLVMDPVVSFLDKSVATHNDQSVRAALGLLAAMADEHQCAVLLVRHLNKEERQRWLYRGGGSIGFLAASRCVWLVAPDPKQAGVSVVAQVKNNLKVLQPSLAYTITDAPGGGPQFRWLGPSPLQSHQLLGRQKKIGRPRTQSERAAESLRLFLEEAPRTRSDVLDFAEDLRISERTLNRAKQALGIRSVWVGGGKKKAIFWLLPGQLPEEVTEDQLFEIKTREQEAQALCAEGMERVRELVERGPSGRPGI